MASQVSTPLGIADLLMQAKCENTRHPVVGMPHHWYWCRLHMRAEQVNEPTTYSIENDRVPIICIRIGPFMSEREANRLRDMHPEFAEGDRPLGIEVEE